MKITLFNGSPKGKRSNTQVIADAFAAGARDAGAETEMVFLSKKEIKHCRGCLHCWTKTPGKCVMKDDMAALVDVFMASDVAVMVTPLYVDNVSGMTKVFLDRLMVVVDPRFEMGEDGETQHVKAARKFPKLMVISSCGYPERSHFQVLELLFRRIARNMRGELIAEIYRGQGNLLTIEHDMLAPIVDAYKKLASRAGKEIVETGAISEKTNAALDAELIPRDAYNDGANRHWATQLAKIKSRE